MPVLFPSPLDFYVLIKKLGRCLYFGVLITRSRINEYIYIYLHKYIHAEQMLGEKGGPNSMKLPLSGQGSGLCKGKVPSESSLEKSRNWRSFIELSPVQAHA